MRGAVAVDVGVAVAIYLTVPIGVMTVAVAVGAVGLWSDGHDLKRNSLNARRGESCWACAYIYARQLAV